MRRTTVTSGLRNISARICPPGAQTEAPAERLDDLLESYERRVITETLKRHDCNVAKASEALGLGRDRRFIRS